VRSVGCFAPARQLWKLLLMPLLHARQGGDGNARGPWHVNWRLPRRAGWAWGYRWGVRPRAVLS